MSQRSEGQVASLEDLSALMDGELPDPGLGRATTQWARDESAQDAWHCWHLIGDVMRSADLATSPAADSAFLVSLRARLEQEPAVLAPSPRIQVSEAAGGVASRAAARVVRGAWRAPVAVAAGFAVVASVLVVTQLPATRPSIDVAPSLMASAGAGQAAVLASASAAAPGPLSVAQTSADAAVVMDARVTREARLDEYLAAHKRFGGSSGPGGPNGFLRNAVVEGR